MSLPLADSKGRIIEYLRLSVTDRCNYRCTYCLPAGGFEHVERENVLSIEELARVARVFASLGVTTVRLTGGEPTVRGGLVELVALIAKTPGIREVVMTTNGDRLGELARPLLEAGLTRLNISLDTLDPERHRELTRGGIHGRVLQGIDAAGAAGFRHVKLNTVVIGGVNDDEVEALCDYAWERDLVPRFIELMPLGEAGREHGAAAVVPTAQLRRRLAHRIDDVPERGSLPGRGPAVYYPRRGGNGHRVGFIGAVTEQFCSTCNRVRVTCRGELRGCLARPEGTDLKTLMRSGHSDEAIADTIRGTVAARLEGHAFWRPEEGDTSAGVVMTGVGG